MMKLHLRPLDPMRLVTVLAVILAAALVACGGGGGDPPAPEPVPAPQATPTAPAPAAPAPAPVGVGSRATCGLGNFESDALALVNAYRAAGASCGDQGTFPAVPALAWNAALTQASLVHSDDMMALNFFSHTGSSGSNAGQRATAAGYAWQTWGENIAAGQVGVGNVMAGWMASPGHCANIMNARFRDIGVACVNGGESNRYRTYWTMTLGTAR